MKSKLLFLLVILVSFKGFSQNPSDLENKYWNYRDRFKKFYTQIGEKAGQSQAAASIEFQGSKSDSARIINGNLQTGQTPNSYINRIKFGDAVIDQGWYMAVLASEYWLLKNKGQIKTDQFSALCNEIYFAVNAIERLDGNADQYFGGSYNLNGFFIRNDAKSDYLKYFNQLKNTHQPINWIGSGGHSGPQFSFVDTTNGQFTPYDADSFRLKLGTTQAHEFIQWQGGPGQNGKALDFGNEMSQDQVYGCLLGFVCILKWVDSDLTVDPDGSAVVFESKNIHTWIKQITHRIMQHVSKTHAEPYALYDEQDYEKEASERCIFINAHPYKRTDTTWLNPPDSVFDADDNHWVVTYYEVTDTFSASYFTGSTFQTCNVWDYIDEIKSKNNIFKEGNYIITNPVRDDRLVTRGAVATSMAYPLKMIGEWITGETYPDPFCKLTTGNQILRWTLNTVWAGMTAVNIVSIGGMAIKIPTSFLTSVGAKATTAVLEFLLYTSPETVRLLKISEDPAATADIIGAVLNGCPELAPSPDLLSLCIIGKPLEFQNKDFYRDLWNRFPVSTVLKLATKNGLALNLMQNLAIASGTWDQDIFSNWCDYHGYQYSELFYSILNGYTPKKSKNHYENALNRAQCEGIWHGGYKVDYTVEEPPYVYCRPFVHDNLFTRRDTIGKNSLHANSHNGIDYMLMYNLFRMSEIQYWGSNSELKYVRNNCPCNSYPAIRNVNFNRSILETVANNKYDTIDGRIYDQPEMFMPQSTLIASVENINAVYDYYKNYKIRIPNYLLHNLTISGTNNSTNKGRLIINQDLTICNSYVTLNNHSEMEMVENNDASFPSQIIVNTNSTVEINNGSTIKVNNNCRFIVEKNAKLLFNSGAKIILNGPNAVLHIKGTLELAAGATFQIEGGSAGKGYIIWENNDWWGKDNSNSSASAKMIAGAGSKFVLSQSSREQLAMVLLGPQGIVTDYSLAEFNVNNCLVKLGPLSRIMTRGLKTIFNNARIEGDYSNNENAQFDKHITSMGLQVLGRVNSITNCRINNCKQGISTFTEATNFYPLTLNQVEISNCIIGIKNEGNSIKMLNQSKIFYTGQVSTGNTYWVQPWKAIESTASQGSNLISKSLVEAPYWWFKCTDTLQPGERTFGLDYHGNGRYYIQQSDFNFADVGVRGYQGFLRPTCSHLLNNKTMIDVRKNVIFNSANNAWNYYQWNYDNFNPTDAYKLLNMRAASKIFLGDGNNILFGHHFPGLHFIDAGLDPNQPLITATNAGQPDSIDATGNEFHIHYQNLNNAIVEEDKPEANVNLWEVQYGTHFALKVNPPYSGGYWLNAQTDYCAADHSNEPHKHIVPDQSDFFATHPVVQSLTGFVLGKKPFLRDFEPPVPAEYDDDLDSFHAIFNADWPDNSANLVLDIYSDMHNYYRSMFSDTNFIDSTAATLRSEVYSKLLDIQTDLISKSESDSSVWHHFKFELNRDLALIHRSFNYRSVGISVIDNCLPSFTDSSSIVALNEWKCILNREQMAIDSIIPQDSLMLRENCICKQYLDSFIHSPNDTLFTPTIDSSEYSMVRLAENFITFNNNQQSIAANPKIKIAKSDADKPNYYNLKLYPNPAENSVTLSSNQAIFAVRIMDAAGKTIKPLNGDGNSSILIDISGITRGLYIVQATFENGKDQKWLIVNR